MSKIVAVDVGGTFTDLVYYDDATGESKAFKGATTADAPEIGVARLLTQAFPDGRVSEVDYFLHATTIGINALLERKGAVVGLLTTRGFRDVLEVRRGDRESMYDYLWVPPEPLVPRERRRPVTERMTARGTVDTPLDPADIKDAVRRFQRDGVESVAVVFLHAYANPSHELEAERALREFGYQGGITLSHLVSGEYREYERTSTAVVDAYVRPKVAKYFASLETALAAIGFRGRFLVTRSGGGAMTFKEAEVRPFETVMSGPAAGAMGAAELSRRLNISRVITADVGGTSFDTCLIIDGHADIKYEGNIAGMPLQAPWIDVRSIGAGGGSIAHADAGLLRVGPQSATSHPGPVCYGRGGTQPTVTDAAAVLGMLGLGELAGGLRLDIEAARESLSLLGRELRLTTDEVAQGILKVAAAAMVNAIRSMTIERGHDPRDAILMAFGGAGPLLASLVVREADMRRYLIPNYPGTFSAWGLLGQDIRRSAALTSIHPLDLSGIRIADTVLKALFERLRSLEHETVQGTDLHEAALDLRYKGQEYSLTIPVHLQSDSISDSLQDLRQRFSDQYACTFGHVLDDDVEILSVRTTVRRALSRAASEQQRRSVVASPAARGIDAYSFTKQQRMQFDVIPRESLATGSAVSGPAILTEDTSTSYIDAGYVASVDRTGVLFVSEQGE